MTKSPTPTSSISLLYSAINRGCTGHTNINIHRWVDVRSGVARSLEEGESLNASFLGVYCLATHSPLNDYQNIKATVHRYNFYIKHIRYFGAYALHTHSFITFFHPFLHPRLRPRATTRAERLIWHTGRVTGHLTFRETTMSQFI